MFAWVTGAGYVKIFAHNGKDRKSLVLKAGIAMK
jgi:hypothetical protein